MLYIDRTKEKYGNYWFCSSDDHTVKEFNNLLGKDNIDKLEDEGDACIVYTHFVSSFVNDEGKLNKEFEDSIRYLSAKEGWFVPASTLLDYLRANKKETYVSSIYLARLDFKWIIDRIIRLIKEIKFKR